MEGCNTLPLVFQQICICDALRQLRRIVGYKNHRLVRLTAKTLNYLDAMLQVIIIEAMERFVKYQQLWILHQSAGKKHKTLLGR